MQVKMSELNVDKMIDGVKIRQAIDEVLSSGSYINGPFTEEFAELYAKYCYAKYCVPVSSGSAALTLTLKNLRQKRKRTNLDRAVIVPTLSFAATSMSVIEAGFKPLYCPVDIHGLMDVNILNKLLTDWNPYCIIPVHLYGQHVKIDLSTLRKDVVVVDDACQAHGVLRGVSHDDGASCYSFYPSKNLGGVMDGGAVVTNNHDLFMKIRMHANYGDFPGTKYNHTKLGGNYRMSEINAAVLLQKLKSLEMNNALRIDTANLYHNAGIISFVKMKRNVFHQYPILVDHPNQFREEMRDVGIETGNHYPYVLHDKVEGILTKNTCMHSSHIATHVVTLPIRPHISAEEIDYVINSVLRIADYIDTDKIYEIK